jgi:hypothetical protein
MRIKDILFFLKKFPKKKVALLEALGVASPAEPAQSEAPAEE